MSLVKKFLTVALYVVVFVGMVPAALSIKAFHKNGTNHDDSSLGYLALSWAAGWSLAIYAAVSYLMFVWL